MIPRRMVEESEVVPGLHPGPRLTAEMLAADPEFREHPDDLYLELHDAYDNTSLLDLWTTATALFDSLEGTPMTEIPGQLELPYEDLPEPEPEPDALTAFLVVVDHTGAAIATADLGKEMTVERSATLADMRRACMEVTADIAALHVAEKVAESTRAQRPATPASRVRQRMQERGIQAPGRG